MHNPKKGTDSEKVSTRPTKRDLKMSQDATAEGALALSVKIVQIQEVLAPKALPSIRNLSPPHPKKEPGWRDYPKVPASGVDICCRRLVLKLTSFWRSRSTYFIIHKQVVYIFFTAQVIFGKMACNVKGTAFITGGGSGM